MSLPFGFLAEIACWMYTGERQVSALRRRYLEAVLKQDVGFFDTDARTGDIVFSVSTDTLLVQDAISEKVSSPRAHVSRSMLVPSKLSRAFRGSSA